MTHSRWDELAAGYALSALEPGEEQEFVAHLRGCDVCERMLAGLHGVVGELAYTATPAEPPASLLESVRAGIGAGDRPVLAPAPRARRRTVSRTWLLGAAAMVVILVLGLWNAVLRIDSRRKDEVIALRRQFERLLTDPASTRVVLEGQGSAVAVVRDGRVMLLVHDLPVSDPGSEIYVLWARDRAGRLSAVERFEVGNPGQPNLIPEMPLRVTGLAGLAVSREPGPEPPAAPSVALLSGVLT